ncbi:prepilin-type N-terminal cleavage/methylation domain-containing protein [bacterium]|nr:MAG: prepilin-type N-terminal cleavage/methylation domain-containing protein [bacterium]
MITKLLPTKKGGEMNTTQNVKGFTLIEIIVVMIIVGILATLGLTQYARMAEKGRTAEAKSILGTIRSAQNAKQLETGSYSDMANLSVSVPAACQADYYFSYNTSATDGSASASRCTSGGKQPQGPSGGYFINITQAGAWSGTAGYF